jgi:hypothetical protein
MLFNLHTFFFLYQAALYQLVNNAIIIIISHIFAFIFSIVVFEFGIVLLEFFHLLPRTVVKKTRVLFFLKLIEALLNGRVSVGVGNAQSLEFAVLPIYRIVDFGWNLTVVLAFTFFNFLPQSFYLGILFLNCSQDNRANNL